jgi:predicted AAA+ superfamily ATPase
MNERIIGRTKELRLFKDLLSVNGAQLICVYGRRRIGKSFLLDHAFKNETCLKFEGLENEHTELQIKQFTQDLARQTGDRLLAKAKATEWFEILDKLTDILKGRKEKTVVLIDEFQWLAAQKSILVSLFKKYWDQEWSKCNVIFVLCGSVSSYMVKKVIKSKALYGRINLELNLGPLSLTECASFVSNRSKNEVLKYYLTFGGVPKYWKLIEANKSYEQNIEKLFLQEEGYLFNEYEKVFYSQFKEPRMYETIVNHLIARPLTLEEIARKLNKKSSGSLKSYLDNLSVAGFLISYTPYNKSATTKLKKYKVSDEYVRYFFKFIKANQKIIKNNQMNKRLFERLIQPKWEVWSGFAFENFCLKNAISLAHKMGFDEYVETFGPYFNRNNQANSSGTGFQIDLLYKRSDRVITLCEIKYLKDLVTAKVIPEVERKIKHLEIPRGYTLEKALITVHGADKGLTQSKYFDHLLAIEDM